MSQRTPPTASPHPNAHPPRTRSAIALIALIALAWIPLTLLAPRIDPTNGTTAALTGWVACLGAAGLLFVALCPLLARRGTTGLVVTILVAGLAMRAGAFTHAPVMEDDFHRYLLDGATTANGLDPFAVAPNDLLAGAAPDRHLERIDSPAARWHTERVNHPHLRTIYPTTAQAAFAAAHAIEPWSVNALRLVFLAAELAALAAILFALRRLALPLTLAGIYWLNPIVINQIIAQAHMDALAYAPIALAIAARLVNRHLVAAALLAVAVGAKLWPIALVPLLFSPLIPGITRPKALASTAAALGLSALVLAPAASAVGNASGLESYTAHWQNNAFLFPLIESVCAATLDTLGLHALSPGTAARAAAAAAVAAAALTAARAGTPRDIPARAATVLAVLFFVSPTQFPWYFTWIAPFLVFVPRSALRVSAALLPLYHLAHLAPWIPAVQHAPPLAWAAAKRILNHDAR
jgi:hypothetical protein